MIAKVDCPLFRSFAFRAFGAVDQENDSLARLSRATQWSSPRRKGLLVEGAFCLFPSRRHVDRELGRSVRVRPVARLRGEDKFKVFIIDEKLFLSCLQIEF